MENIEIQKYGSIIPRRLAELWSYEGDDKTIVLSDAKLSLDKYCLDQMGTFIWRHCDGHSSVEKLADLIIAECEDSAPSHNQVVPDIMSFLQPLREEGLVTWRDSKSIDILLVVPPASSVYSPEALKTPEYSAPPLGLCYIASMLKQHGYGISIYDMHQSAAMPEDIVKKCRELNPKIVGITASTPSFPNATQVARFAKAWNQDTVTIIGGPHATGAPDQCLFSGSFDFVCIGEGEETMPELANAIIKDKSDSREIPGLAYLSDDKVVFSSSRKRLTNLDAIPLPARDLIDIDKYYQKGSLVSSRGCPIGCDFCACASISGNTYRTHSIDYVLNEVEHMMKKYGYHYFDFHDDTFNLHTERVFKFCEEIKKRKLNFKWGCFCRAAQLTLETAKAMAEAGCTVIQFGVESGNDVVLESTNKKTTVQQIINAVTFASKAGITQITCGFIIGHANDTEQTVQDTINLGLRLHDLGATRLTLSLLTPYPGTKIYDNRDELGIELLTDDWEQYTFSRLVAQTKYLDKKKLRELYVEGILRFLEVSR